MKIFIKNPLLLVMLVAGLSLVLSGQVTAQILTTLHNFSGGDGAKPHAGLIISGNTMYGAAENGGTAGSGTVFAISTNGTGFTNLYNFTTDAYGDNSDGSGPDGNLLLSGSTLYGTAYGGGTNGNGSIFGISTNGTFAPIYSFSANSGEYSTNGDGANPEVGLVLSGNTLYGTTEYGGTDGYGAVFKVNTDGTGFLNLYSFTNGSDGSVPNGLLLSGNTLYGTALGLSGNGTVFALVCILTVPP